MNELKHLIQSSILFFFSLFFLRQSIRLLCNIYRMDLHVMVTRFQYMIDSLLDLHCREVLQSFSFVNHNSKTVANRLATHVHR